jgi:hypothetical protein
MTSITTYFSAITQILIDSILQLKDTEWQVELKQKIQPFVAYKKKKPHWQGQI